LENIKEVYQSISFGPQLGPMWFAMLLLILSFALIPLLVKDRFGRSQEETLASTQIVLFALVIGFLTFVLRIFQPVGSVFQPLNLQLPHTLQYISLFLAGSLAYHRNWLDEISTVRPRNWILMIAGLLIVLPVVFILSGGLEGNVDPALGGWHWQSLAYALWEQLLCVSLILVYLYYFRLYASRTSPLLNELAASSYAAYLIHPLVLVVLTTLLASIRLHPLGKIAMALIPGLVLSFLAAGIIRRIPLLRRVL
jgi:surface polysaccharide O-acyltransferase-like enzyme